jgi:hypothetical protein
MIWEMVLPCPRIVSVEMRSLRKTHLEWEREKEVNKTAENTRDSETIPKRPGVDPPPMDGHLPRDQVGYSSATNTTRLPRIICCCNKVLRARIFYSSFVSRNLFQLISGHFIHPARHI